MTDILLIEDEEAMARAFRSLLEGFGYEVTIAYTSFEGLAALVERPAAVILDLWLPDSPGEGLIPTIRELLPPPLCKIIVWTALPYGKRITDVEAMKPDALFFKPGSVADLLKILPVPHNDWNRAARLKAIGVVEPAADGVVKALEHNSMALRANTQAIVEASHKSG